MKRWALIVIMILLLGGFASLAHGAGARAGETISTDKSVYILGEDMTITIHGNNLTYYYLYIDGSEVGGYRTNETGYRVISYPVSFIGVGGHYIQLERYGIILASKYVIIREGLTLEESDYTHSYTYLNGETLWVRLSGENNTLYKVDISNATGAKVYPKNGSISIRTNNTGIAVFSIKLNIGDGDYTLDLYNGTNLIQSKPFSVRSVQIVASLDKGYDGVYLLSERIHAYVSIYWMKTHALLPNVNYKWWIVDASNHSASFGPYPGHGSEFTTQKLSFYTMGNNPNVHITPNTKYYVKIVYENNNDTGKHYAEQKIYFYTGLLSADIHVNDIDHSLSPGKRVVINVYTYAVSYINNNGYNVYTSPLSHVKLDYLNITITKHWQILWYHNYTNYGYTDASGNAYLLWIVPQVEQGSTVSIRGEVSINNEHYHVYFLNMIVTADVDLSISTDKSFYIAGDTMVVKMHSYSPKGISVQGYDVEIFTSGKLFYYTSTTHDEVSYKLPDNYSGVLSVSATAYFSDGESQSASTTVNVYYGYIYLSASQNYYFKAGDEITIYSDFKSNVMHPQVLSYKIMDDHARIIERLNASLTSFKFTIPNDESTSYTIMAEAFDGSYYASNTLTINKFEGYVVSSHIVTKPSYQNMIYEPGQNIEIAYNIVKYGDFTPQGIVLHWAIIDTDYHWEKELSANDMTGTITLTLPKELKGGYVVEIWVTDSSGSFSKSSLLTLNVESGAWSMQDIAGMPMLSFINLILVIVAIAIGIVAILMHMRRGKSGGESEEEKPEKSPKPPKFKKHKSKKKGAPKPYSPTGEKESKEEELELGEEAEFSDESDTVEKDFGDEERLEL